MNGRTGKRNQSGRSGYSRIMAWSDWVLSLFALSKVVRQQFVGDVGTFIFFSGVKFSQDVCQNKL